MRPERERPVPKTCPCGERFDRIPAHARHNTGPDPLFRGHWWECPRCQSTLFSPDERRKNDCRSEPQMPHETPDPSEDTARLDRLRSIARLSAELASQDVNDLLGRVKITALSGVIAGLIRVSRERGDL